MEDSSEEVPIPIPAPIKAHMEDDCFWIARRNRLVKLPRTPSVEAILREYYVHCSTCSTEETNLPHLAEVLDGVKIYFDFMLADHLLYSQERCQYKNVILDAAQVDRQEQELTEQELTSAKSEPGDVSGMVDGRSECCGGGRRNVTAGGDVGSARMGMDGPSSNMVNHVATSSNTTRQRPPDPSSVYGVEHLLRLFVRLPNFLSRAQLPSSHVQTLHVYLKDFLGYICSRRQELFSEDNYTELSPTLDNPGPS